MENQATNKWKPSQQIIGSFDGFLNRFVLEPVTVSA
jgi:hypothetical protein